MNNLDSPVKIFIELHVSSPIPRFEWQGWIEKMTQAIITQKKHTVFNDSLQRDIYFNIVSDAEIAAINELYLNCTGPTNILSFPDGNGFGTLFLSIDTLEREAFLYGQNLRTHAIRLLAHGMGHIHGFDHGIEMDEFCSLLEKSISLE